MLPHRAMVPALVVLAFATAAQAQQNDLPKFAGVWTVMARLVEAVCPAESVTVSTTL